MDEQGKELARSIGILSFNQDQEWLDTINVERRTANLDKVSYETFEIVMDRLEKEWFDLVSSRIPVAPLQFTYAMFPDKESTKTRPGYAL